VAAVTNRDAGAQSAKGEAAMIDFELSGGGTVYLLRPVSRAAHAWVEEHLPPDAAWWCGAVVVEHRHIVDRRGLPRAMRSARSSARR